MNISFSKYQGTGNDFILIDNREKKIALTTAQVAFLCNRYFGIGADGLMYLENEEGYDFKMVYYNSDGNTSTMCGNGGRCITAFAKRLGVIDTVASFVAVDGPHEALVNKEGIVSLKMKDVTDIAYRQDAAVLDTGSPHYIKWVDDVAAINVFDEGKGIRNQEEFLPQGINVNFVHQLGEDEIEMRTYERGVENETLSCGTGVTAAAIACNRKLAGRFETKVHTKGGLLTVSFDKEEPTVVTQVVLSGPATFVFDGEIAVPEAE